MKNITPKLDQKLVDEFNDSPISLTYLKSILKNDGRERRRNCQIVCVNRSFS